MDLFTHRYLLDHGAFPAPVNNEGDTPYDLVEESEAIQQMISDHVKAQGVDVDAVRNLEEAVMLEDANKYALTIIVVLTPGHTHIFHFMRSHEYPGWGLGSRLLLWYNYVIAHV